MTRKKHGFKYWPTQMYTAILYRVFRYPNGIIPIILVDIKTDIVDMAVITDIDGR